MTTIAGGTKIQWCDETFSPWWGCEKVSPGCAHCYAEGIAKHRVGAHIWGPGHGYRWMSESTWKQPLMWARRSAREGRSRYGGEPGERIRVFCASMADVFEDRPELEEPRIRLFRLIEDTPELDWLVLTKRPEFARDWLARFGAGGHHHRALPWPLPNVWMGVSIENSWFTWRADVLRQIPAAVRFISAEPLLGSLFDVRLRAERDTGYGETGHARRPLDLTGISWIIIGGESGPKARPFHLEHAREIIHAARCVECDGHGWTVETATVTRTRWEQGPGGDPVPVPYPEPEPYQVECARCFGTGGPAVFVKQLGAKPVGWTDVAVGEHEEQPLKLRDSKGGDWDEWPADLRVREFPRGAT